MGTPPAEVGIDEGLVRRLLASQHPDLAKLPLQPVAEGWDNAIYRIGSTLSIRLPRRALAAALVLNEQRWLAELQPRLPLAIPVPVRTGAPQDEYPWHWSVTHWLDGATADLAVPDASQGVVLARFLAALHLPAPSDAPHNPYRGVPIIERTPTFIDRLDRAATPGSPLAGRLGAIWESAVAAPADPVATWIHGDLHPRNVLVADGRLEAVIDWGDLAGGDRATDLAAVWMLLPDTRARALAIAGYGPAPAGSWRRARGWAALFSVILLAAGSADDERMALIGRNTIARLLADETRAGSDEDVAFLL
jgi:aminoglycoside phosphotransferase (APT) family kinase protein